MENRAPDHSLPITLLLSSLSRALPLTTLSRAPLRHLDEKAAVAKTAIADYSAQAYDAAAKSQLAAKGAETISSAYTTVVNQPAVVAVSAKTGEAAGQLRSKLAEKLVELREGAEKAPPVGNGAV